MVYLYFMTLMRGVVYGYCRLWKFGDGAAFGRLL